jgi:GxxExxY protein
MNTAQLNELSYGVIGAAIAVHRDLGPGLEEPDYEAALSAELAAEGIQHVCQQPVPVIYKNVHLDAGYRIDVLVERSLILELKSVETVHPVHESQLLTYLRLSLRKLGLLINFDVPVLKDGVRRKVMGLEEPGVEIGMPGNAELRPFSTEKALDELSHQVLGAAIEVHRHLGPGLLKSAYEECLCYELSTRGLPFERSKPLAIRFRDIDLPKPAEIDLVVAGELPLMIVSVAEITPLLEARLIGRLKNGGWKHGLLLNFSEKKLGAGIRRLVHPSLWGR